MNLLGAVNYDPAVAVSKATSALLAMTAFDTTNLRLAITVPAHGKVLFRMKGALTGATTLPAILFGVMNGATVLGRQSPQMFTGTQSLATMDAYATAEFVVTGLTPGAMNVDAAYAVQVVVAATNIKYGGPNTNAGANAWGGFAFEAFDPQPIPIVAPGAAGGLLIAGANAATTFATLTSTGALSVNGVNSVSQTGDSFARIGAPVGASISADIAAVKTDTAAVKVQTDKLTFTVANQIDSNVLDWKSGTAPTMTGDSFARLGAPVGASISADIAAVQSDTGNLQTRVPAALVGGRIDASVGSNLDKTGYGLSAAAVQSIWDALTSALTTVGSIGKLIATNLDALISSRMASFTQPTGFLAATFPSTVASPTNITAGVITTVTNLTNAPTAGDFTATMKTSLNAATPAVTVSDKTGFSLTQSFPANFASLGIGASGHVLTVDTLTTYSGNTPQTGDAFARIGLAGVGLTNLGDTRIANLDATVSSRFATTGYTAPDNSDIVSIKATLGVAGAGLTALGDTRLANLDATVSSRSTFAGGAVASVTGNVGDARLAHLDADISSRLASASYTAPDNADIVAIRAKTDGLPSDPADASDIAAAFSVVGSAISGLNNLSAAGVRAAVGLASANLDTQLDALPSNAELATALAGADDATLAAIAAVAASIDAISTSAGDPWSAVLPGLYAAGTAGNIIGSKLDVVVSSRLASASYTAPDNAGIAAIQVKTAALPNDPADASDIAAALSILTSTISGLNNLSPAGVRAAVGLVAANLDTQLDALPTNAELATALAGADDAALAAIAALSIPTPAAVADEIATRTLNANIKEVNGVVIHGDGAATPWGP